MTNQRYNLDNEKVHEYEFDVTDLTSVYNLMKQAYGMDLPSRAIVEDNILAIRIKGTEYQVFNIIQEHWDEDYSPVEMEEVNQI